MDIEKKDVISIRMSTSKKKGLLKKYAHLLTNNGGLSAGIEKAKAENPGLEELLKKDPNRFIRGCG